MNKIRKGDEVIVTAGKDKGRRGTVLQVNDDGRVLVEGINLAKKHVKAQPECQGPAFGEGRHSGQGDAYRCVERARI